MRVSRTFLIDACIIIIYIILFSLPLGVFWGSTSNYSNFPKGDDAETHAAIILFVSKNWPNINWYPNWYSGLPLFLGYQPLAYFFWGLFTKATGFSVASTLFLFTALSYLLTAIALYALIYKITSNRYSALLAPILLITSGSFICPLITGGTYTRVFATMFWMFSLLSLFSYLKSPSEKKFYLATVLLLAVTITSNLLIGLISVITTLVVLLVCSKSIKEGVTSILKIFIPIMMLSAFFYFPFLLFYFCNFVSFTISGGNYSNPQPLIYLVVGSFVPLLLLLVAFFLGGYAKTEFDALTRRFSRALLILMLFFFLYGFTVLPSHLRFMATYDSTYFFSIYVSIYCGIYLGAIFNKIAKEHSLLKTPDKLTISRFRKIRLQIKRLIPLIILLSGLILPLFYYPFLMQYVVDPEDPSWYYPAYIAEQLTTINANEKNSRFSSDWVHVERWFNYRYDLPQTGGVEATAVLYPQWGNWFQDAVFTTPNNWIETNFLFDWYGVKRFMVSNISEYSGGGAATSYGLVNKFLGRPEYYTVDSVVEVPSESYWKGPVYLFEYKNATPIMSSSDAPTLLVVGDNNAYDAVFQSLAYSGYDSRFLIPVRGSAYIDDYSLEDLERFDVLVLDGYLYRKSNLARKLLDDYVNNGGGLIIEAGDIDTSVLGDISPVNRTQNVIYENCSFTYPTNPVSDWIDTKYFSPPHDLWISPEKDVMPLASTVLRANGYPTVVIGMAGKGRVIFDGLDTPKRSVVDKNQMESFFFSQLTEWVGHIGETASFRKIASTETVKDWIMNRGADVTNGSLNVSNKTKMDGSNSLELGYIFKQLNLPGEYVEYKCSPSNISDLGNAEFLSFWMYGDNSTNQLKVAILAPNWDNCLQTFLKIDWSGWRKIVIPLSGMEETGEPSLSNVGGVSFVVDETAVGDGLWHWLYLSNIGIIQTNPSENSPRGVFCNPNPEKFVVRVSSSSGVLFKESYFQNWHAYLVDSEGLSKSLDIYRVGPDFMYVFIPNDIKLPVEVVFEYRKSPIEWLSLFLSFLTLFALIIYGLRSRYKKVGIRTHAYLMSKIRTYSSFRLWEQRLQLTKQLLSGD